MSRTAEPIARGRAASTRSRAPLSLAYASFLAVGCIVGSKQLLNAVGAGSGEGLYYGGALFTILPVVFVVGLVAAGVGVVVAIARWREWPLCVLALATCAVPFASKWSGGVAAMRSASEIYPVLYAVLAVLVPLRWFLLQRGRRSSASELGSTERA